MIALSPAALAESLTLAGSTVRRGSRIAFDAHHTFGPYSNQYSRVSATVTAVVHQDGETYVELWCSTYCGHHDRWFRVQGSTFRAVSRSRHDGRFVDTWSNCSLYRFEVLQTAA